MLIMMYKENNIGLTMLELLIVMSIIGIMATFGTVTYPGVQRNARDTQRRSDLKQYHTSLETYANRSGGFYPGRTSVTPPYTYASDQNGITPNLCDTDLNLSECPADPKANQNVCGSQTCNYYYISNGTNGTATATSPTATRFVLFSRLENRVNDQFVFFVICSDGSTGTTPLTWTPSSVCPL